VSEWESPEGGWLSTLDTPDESLFWGLTPEGFVAWDAVGRRVHTFPAGGLTVLRDVVGVAFQDHTVLVASGGGYRNLSVLCVFDAANRLIYQEVLPSRTYAILADSTEAGFYLGADQTVVRYRLAGLGQWESSNTVRGSRGAVRCAGSREAWILWVG
jgi:hypothetical protein